jgi:DNA end-binding protein Ku
MAATHHKRRSTRHRASTNGSANGRTAAASDAPAVRPIWSGTISFGLVAVPVNLFPAVRPADAGLRLLAPSGEPVERHYLCPEHGKDAPWDQLVRGYELDDGKHVTLTDDELEAIAPRKSRDIDLRRFVPREELDPLLFERAYVLTPAGESTKPYRLLAAAMAKGGKVGIATFVMRTKEYLVAIVPHRGVLWAETLRFAGELRAPKDLGLTAAKKTAAADVAAFTKVIHRLERDEVSRDELVERRSVRLRSLAERKLAKGDDVVVASAPAAADDGAATEEAAASPDLFESIRSSLQLLRGKSDGAARSPTKSLKAGRRPRASPRSTTASSGRSRAKGRRLGRAAAAR